jgi:nucleoside-diphosphate kinase
MEKTLIFIKPDAVKRGICGEIIGRFERVGLKVASMRLLWLTKQQADKFYPNDKEWLAMLATKVQEAYASKGKKFNRPALAYGKQVKRYLIDYVTSGPVLAFILEGNEAISISRKLVGSTDPSAAPAGTIRGDYCSDSLYAANVEKRACRTLMHAAGNAKEARDQIKLIFGSK